MKKKKLIFAASVGMIILIFISTKHLKKIANESTFDFDNYPPKYKAKYTQPKDTQTDR